MDDGTSTELVSRLRADTERLFEELDEVVGVASIVASRLAYSGHLARLWQAHSALDAALCEQNFSSFGLDYAARRRSPLLEADLRSMGYPPGSLPEWLIPEPPRYATLAHALGGVYAVERVAVAARAALPRIRATFGYDESRGASYFAGLDPEGASGLRPFLSAINLVAPGGPDADKVVDGAIETLAFIREHVPAQPKRAAREDVAS